MNEHTEPIAANDNVNAVSSSFALAVTKDADSPQDNQDVKTSSLHEDAIATLPEDESDSVSVVPPSAVSKDNVKAEERSMIRHAGATVAGKKVPRDNNLLCLLN